MRPAIPSLWMGEMKTWMLEPTRRSAPLGSRGAWKPAALIALLIAASAATAGPREQAKRLHDRIAGVPPAAATLDTMESQIAGGDAVGAAYTAMDHEAFYAVTLKDMVTPWTNRDRTMFAPLNDYSATVIGMVRDDVSFDTLLSADLVYTGAAGLGLPSYSMTDNQHYEALESSGADLRTALVATSQSQVTDLPPSAIAGVMSTRAAAAAFFIAGTNRAMFRFTLLNHLCTDLEQLQDPTRPPDRIRQDVSRSPGGDSRIFLNNCIGCHSGMDPLAQAFAYYDFDTAAGRIVYTQGQVQPKYHINSENFALGYSTPDDGWQNYWRQGQNNLLGWSSTLPGSGSGAASLGDELAASDAFATCQVEKVFRTVCLRDPTDAADRSQITTMAANFRASGYQLKQAFAEGAVYCMGD